MCLISADDGRAIQKDGGIHEVVGALLLSLTLACWFAADDRTAATFGVIKAMLFYDVAAIGVFLYSRFGFGLGGILLWPAIAIHAGLAMLLIWAWSIS